MKLKQLLLAPIFLLSCFVAFSQTDSLQYVQLTTTSREKVVGKLVAKDEQYTVVESTDGVRKEFRTYEVKELLYIQKEDIHRGKYWFPDVNKYRYVAGSSAVPLQKGHGYVQTAYGVIYYGTVGLSDHFSIGAGTYAENLWYGGPSVYFMSIRYSGKISSKLFLGGEFIGFADNVKLSSFSQSSNNIIGAGRALLTFMNSRWNITGSVGYGVVRRQKYYNYWNIRQDYKQVKYVPFHYPMYSFSAQYRVSRRFGLVLENNLLPQSSSIYNYSHGQIQILISNYTLYSAAGMKIFGKHWSLCLGLFGNYSRYDTEMSFGPYLDLCYKFGK